MQEDGELFGVGSLAEQPQISPLLQDGVVLKLSFLNYMMIIHVNSNRQLIENRLTISHSFGFWRYFLNQIYLRIFHQCKHYSNPGISASEAYNLVCFDSFLACDMTVLERVFKCYQGRITL